MHTHDCQSDPWLERIHNLLKLKHQQQAYRYREVMESRSGCHIVFKGKRYLNFSSNDYLGLSQHPQVTQAWQKGVRMGVGSGGSTHVTGYHAVHAVLEEQLADWLGYPRALLFSSGYAANQAIIESLLTQDDYVLMDKLCHASLIAAASVGKAKWRRFAHNQSQALIDGLSQSQSVHQLIVTEGVFSMDGDCAPLADFTQIAQQHRAWLVVDDAHGIGVRGNQGRGSCDVAQIQPEILIVTFGKAFGVSGAALLCQSLVAEYLLQCARPLIYTTAMPLPQAHAILAALECVKTGDALREQLSKNIQRFVQQASAENLPILPSETAIQGVVVGENSATLSLARQLADHGIWTTAIRPPTVARRRARLRITLTALHTEADIDQLVAQLGAAYFKFNGTHSYDA